MPSPNYHFVLHHSALKDCVDVRQKCARKYQKIMKRFGFDFLDNKAIDVSSEDEGDFFYITDKKTGEIISAARADIASEKTQLSVEKVYLSKVGKLPYWRTNMTPNTYIEGCGHWVDANYHGFQLTNICIRSTMLAGIMKEVKNFIIFNNEYTLKNSACFGLKQDLKLGENGILFYPDERYPSVISLLKLSQYASKLNSEEYRIISAMIENLEGSYQYESKGNLIEVDYSLGNLKKQAAEHVRQVNLAKSIRA